MNSMKKPTSSMILAALLTVGLPMGAVMSSGCRTTVTSPARTVPDDAYISTRVKTALLNDPEISSRIDVETAGGVVTLSGAVKTPAERDKAVAIARKITGVSDVKSTLQVQ
jgi:osmotically-inducible protein OsmY